jgi:hypothetical protein
MYGPVKKQIKKYNKVILTLVKKLYIKEKRPVIIHKIKNSIKTSLVLAIYLLF